MDHKPGLFIDDYHVVVFINNVQGNVFRLDYRCVVWRVIEHYGNDFAGLYLVIGFYGLAVDANTSRVRTVLDPVARGIGNPVCQEFVNADRGLSGIGLKPEMFVSQVFVFPFQINIGNFVGH